MRRRHGTVWLITHYTDRKRVSDGECWTMVSARCIIDQRASVLITCMNSEARLKVSYRRSRTARPVSNIIRSYLIVMAILLAFLAGLFLLVALELLLIG